MKKRIVYSLIIISLIVLLDQTTKYLARTYIDPSGVIGIMPGLNLVNVRNKGAAFGIFTSLGNTFFIIISIIAIIVMLWIIVKGLEDYRVFSFLAGGAAGNLIDRLALGSVVDFIDVSVSGYHWPAFNVADSSLTIGIFFMLIQLFTKRN
ncbi:MAG: signal peptidase II [Nitrospirota bacterium]|nr:signal peptidase II [Nitrospirota bacterium]